MYATFGRNHGVQLIDDHVLYFADNGLERGEVIAMARLSGRDEDVGWFSHIFCLVGLRCITCSETDSNLLSSVGKIMFGDFVQRPDEVSLNVVCQRFDGGDVNGVNFLFQLVSRARRTSWSMTVRKAVSVFPELRTKEQAIFVHDRGWRVFGGV